MHAHPGRHPMSNSSVGMRLRHRKSNCPPFKCHAIEIRRPQWSQSRIPPVAKICTQREKLVRRFFGIRSDRIPYVTLRISGGVSPPENKYSRKRSVAERSILFRNSTNQLRLTSWPFQARGQWHQNKLLFSPIKCQRYAWGLPRKYRGRDSLANGLPGFV